MMVRRAQGKEKGKVEPAIEDFVSHCFGPQAITEEVTSLAGDASDRSYFRVRLNPPAKEVPDTLVVMRLSEPWSEGELPFINIGRYLRSLGLAAPEIYSYRRDWGMLALEDCGDTTLQEAFRAEPSTGLKEYYFRALDDLVVMQLHGTEEQRAACHAYTYAFDEERFVWELDFAVEHWVRGLLNQEVSPEDQRALQDIFHRIARTMLDQKLYFTHRDYHSRNLMVRGDRLHVLDFQDARLGPPQYDLASLLRDSYVSLPQEWQEQFMEYYFRRRKEEGDDVLDREEFMRLYKVNCLQRNLKAIGTFASQKMLRGNDSYLRYIPPTFSYIEDNLRDNQEFSPLGDILARYIPPV